MSTLLCCALPALLVSLGLGAVMAGLAANVPALIWVSENKPAVFTAAALMLLINGALLWLNRNAPCPLDPNLRKACLRGRKLSKMTFVASALIYVAGCSFAFL
jgi:hypothetical protein